MTRSRLVLVLIATVVVSTLFGGIAFAEKSPTKLAACVTKKQQLRVLDTKVTCSKNEKRLTWRIKGRPGEPGPKGAHGVKGDKGPEGPVGERGAVGPKGPPGGLEDVHTVKATSTFPEPVPSGSYTALAYCGASERVIGGGFTVTNSDQHDTLQTTMPFVDGNGIEGWQVTFRVVPIGKSHIVTVAALCAHI